MCSCSDCPKTSTQRTSFCVPFSPMLASSAPASPARLAQAPRPSERSACSASGARVLARAHAEAVLVFRAILTQAVLARRGGVLPHRRILGDVGELGAVAA